MKRQMSKKRFKALVKKATQITRATGLPMTKKKMRKDLLRRIEVV